MRTSFNLDCNTDIDLLCPVLIKNKILMTNVNFIVKNTEKPVRRLLKCTLEFLYFNISDVQASLHFMLNKIPLKYKNIIKTGKNMQIQDKINPNQTILVIKRVNFENL